MIKFVFIILIIFIKQSLHEIPRSHCPIGSPFKTKDNLCKDFYEVCVKQNDLECLNFQTICKQCPPSNYSVLMFMDLLTVKNELIKTKDQLEALKTQSELCQNKTSGTLMKQNQQIKKIFTLLWILIFIIAIILVLIVVEVRFKLFTKICRKHQKSKNRYENLKSRKHEYLKDLILANESKSIERIRSSLEETIDRKLNELMAKMESLLDQNNLPIKFKVDSQVLEVAVTENDTAVKIKRDICQRLPGRDSDSFKRMIMKYHRCLIDDNEYLLKRLETGNKIITCEFDEKINPKDFVVLNIEMEHFPGKFIKIRKSGNILDLQKIIKAHFNNPSDLIILKDGLKLEGPQTFEGWLDDTCLRVIESNEKELTISNIFDEKTTVRVTYLPTDSVGIVKKHMADTFSADADRFVLFLRNHSLDENKFMYQYKIENEYSINYCCLQRLNGVELGISLYKGIIYELLKAKDKATKKEMLLLRCNIIAENKFRENEHIVKELRIFQITKSNERFVKLLNIYQKDQNVYVSMENMSEGTLKMYLDKYWPIDIKIVFDWSMKILCGLEYLHQNKIVLRDLNPSTILVDENRDIKLYGFNLSKYTEYYSPSTFSKSDNFTGLSVRYFAPELFLNEDYNEKCDLWSFGVVLVKITTKKKPFPDLSRDQIVNMHRLDQFPYNRYSTEVIEPPLKDIIEKCLTKQDERTSLILLKENFQTKILQDENII